MFELYPDDGQYVEDTEWIGRCAAEGWAALSKDDGLRSGDERKAIEAAGVKVFLLPNQQMSGALQIERYIHHRHRIGMKARKSGHGLYVLHPKTVERL